MTLARSAARSPAPATMMVCGVPFFLEADHSLVGLGEKLSKKAGRLSSTRGLSKEVVSRIQSAGAQNGQCATTPSEVGCSLPLMYLSSNSMELRSPSSLRRPRPI